MCLLSVGPAAAAMEVDRVPVEDEGRLAELRFDAAVKVIKSLPPNGEWPRRLQGPELRHQLS